MATVVERKMIGPLKRADLEKATELLDFERDCKILEDAMQRLQLESDKIVAAGKLMKHGQHRCRPYARAQ